MTAIPAVPAAGRAGTPWRKLAWITWRQQRAALAGLGALLLVLAVFFTVTGPLITGGIHTLVRGHCLTGPASIGLLASYRCAVLAGTQRNDGWPLTVNLQGTALLLAALPLLAGVFLGAPLLAREYEGGTFRFAWTQAISPGRALAARLTLITAALAAAGAALGALMTWWLGRASVLTSLPATGWQVGLTALTFPCELLLLFALGVLAGAVIRRTVTAMVITAITGTVALFLTTAIPFWLNARLGEDNGTPALSQLLPLAACVLAAALLLGAAAVGLARRHPG